MAKYPPTPFEDFFAGEWQRLLEAAVIPEEVMGQPEGSTPSWDRRAAWLLWSAMHGGSVHVTGGEPEAEDDY